MARQINRLNARKVDSINRPGRHSDGGGLYLVVDKNRSKRWVFMSWRGGRQIEIGLGGVIAVPLKAARDKAAECRRLVDQGRDPREARQATRKIPTFAEFSESVITSLERGFRSTKHRAQWRSSLRTYAAPIERTRVDKVSTADVLSCLEPIWTTKNETALRVRRRIEKVLDAAKATGYRSAENPARWRGHLDHLLAPPSKLQRTHFPAMPWNDVPDFIVRLRDRKAVSALALEFTILTAARSGEVLLATWDEIDLASANWLLPGDRMKAGRPHRVPLSRRPMQILSELETLRTGDFIFPGHRPQCPLSSKAMERLFRRMGVKTVTIHGFRSSFRDWAGDATDHPRDVVESALAHVSGNRTERAYRRGDALEKRRALMDDWAQFCERGLGNHDIPHKGFVGAKNDED